MWFYWNLALSEDGLTIRLATDGSYLYMRRLG